ncbi:RagB/SusD family nutrient uptake outer membrane protein, partial [Parabacteroides sp. OttesenSCG-928-N08]|nr:RagB/SusD family nutrient uptake outer membrane protein [Parabacteroides sp. OttesenSCG-928-N08]
MRQFNLKIVFLLLATLLLSTACHDDLLNQPSSVDLPSYYYWKTVDDAEYVLNGAKADVRGLFDRDYYFDGMGEYLRVRGNTISSNAATMVGGVAYRGFYQLDPISYGYSFSNMYTYCYAGIHRANYVIEGVENMLETIDNPTIRKDLERVVGEA